MLALLGGACASSTPLTAADPGGDRILDVETLIARGMDAIGAGDRTLGRLLLAESEAIIDRELSSHPDRHQLRTRTDELRQAIIHGPKRAVVVQRGASDDDVDEDAGLDGDEAPLQIDPDFDASPKAAAPAPLLASSVDSAAIDDLLDPQPLEEVVDAFRRGPLRARKRGLKDLRKGKRIKSKKKKRRMFVRARSALRTCAAEGRKLVDDRPQLESVRFRVGRKKLTADSIVGQCQTKLAWVERKLMKKKKRRRRRRPRT